MSEMETKGLAVLRLLMIAACCLAGGLATAGCSSTPVDQTASYADGYNYANLATDYQGPNSYSADPVASCATFSLHHMLASDDLNDWEAGCIAFFRGAPPPH